MNSKIIWVTPQLAIPLSEISFRSSRSGGPGGQNVNKVESRVELTFDIVNSQSLSDVQRAKVSKALRNKIDSNGILHLTSQKSRSQWENKETVLTEFSRLLKTAIKPSKKRIRTHPSKAVREERLKEKRIIARKKRTRGRFDLE